MLMESDVAGEPRFQTLLTVLSDGWSPLPDKPEETLELTARSLWFAAAGQPRSVRGSGEGKLPALDQRGMDRLSELVELRKAGKPLAHLTGRQNFAGLEMLSGPEALIPRRETELLALAATEILMTRLREVDDVFAIDVCTGSGNVALALAACDSRTHVVGADISAEALRLAARNANHLGLSAQTSFLASDLFEGLDPQRFHRRVDLITCNPPYIASSKVSAMAPEIAEHEPRLAFDGGAFGLTIISRVLADAPRFLRVGGSLCFEVGAGNGRFWADRLERNRAYSAVRAVRDHDGIIRVLVATAA
jgi:release factor glutamine methyltransferase